MRPAVIASPPKLKRGRAWRVKRSSGYPKAMFYAFPPAVRIINDANDEADFHQTNARLVRFSLISIVLGMAVAVVWVVMLAIW